MTSSQYQSAAWLAAMKLGQHHLNNGNIGAALSAYQQATKITPQRPEGWINFAVVLLRAGQIDAGGQAADNAVRLAPRSPQAHELLGDACRMKGRPKQALDAYERSVALARRPEALNKLACAVRETEDLERAEQLYLEAEQAAPGFTLPRVNRAILQVERERYDRARELLTALSGETLSPQEAQEIRSALLSLDEMVRLEAPVARLLQSRDLAGFTRVIADTPSAHLEVDREAMVTVDRYLTYALEHQGSHRAVAAQPLPDDWADIEAAHMIPLVASAEELRALQADPASSSGTAVQVQQTLNMIPAIVAAADAQAAMADPVQAEAQLRYWHGLCLREVDLPGVRPGHFKYTQNSSTRSPNLKRVSPAWAAGTIRHLIARHYRQLAPGVERAAFVLQSLADLHPFSDGNGRVALIWMNRELEWAGLMPALFSHELGFQCRLGEAEAIARDSGSLAPVVETIIEGQRYALEFLSALTGLNDESVA